MDSNKYPYCHDRVSCFNTSFNQLIAEKLHNKKYFENVRVNNYRHYDYFIGFLCELQKTYNVKVHTLNHDLFFDFIGRNHVDLYQHFADGFKLEGSPFYGRISCEFNPNTAKISTKSRDVRLEQFMDKFDKPLCLFKLHGSLFNTIVYTPPNQEPVRLKYFPAVERFKMEIADEKTGKKKLEYIRDKVDPDFLSGTKNKKKYYKGDA
jgi:hypothetical protein